MKVLQEEYNQWNADRTSEMLASMHLSHPRWNGEPYVYAPGSTSNTPYDLSQYRSPMDHDHFQQWHSWMLLEQYFMALLNKYYSICNS